MQPPAAPRPHRAGAAVLMLALIAALTAFAWRGWYTRYLTDDYCSAAVLHDYGFLGAMKFQREIWSGRYSFYPLKAALEAIGPVTTRFVPGALIAATAAAAAWALRRVVRSPWLIGCAVAYAAVDAAPDRFGIYGAVMWETGAIAYMVPIVLVIVWLGVYARGRSIMTSAALLFVAAGFSETSLVTQAVMTAGAAVAALLRRDRRRTWMAAAGLAATIAGAMLMSTAPGNAVRARIHPPRAPLTDAAAMSLRYAYDFIGSHVFLEGASLIVVIAAGTLVGTLAARRAWTEVSSIALLCYAASFFPSALLLSAPPPPRALYVTNFCLVVALFAAAAALAHRLRPHAIVLALLAVLPIASVIAVARAIPEARQGAAQIDRIEELLRTQRGRDVVLRSRWAVESTWAGLDNGHPANRCICWYFGLRSLKVVR